MADSEREDSYYYPGGVPITPQAKRFGFEFPVYVSLTVWRDQCIAHGIPSKYNTSLERRIYELLQYCYDGLGKALATDDNFLFFPFKIWYHDRAQIRSKKKRRARLGARLLLAPDTDMPWLYVFNIKVDSIDTLEKGEPPCESTKSQETRVTEPA